MRKKLPTLAAALLFAALPALGNMETVFEEDFENPETSKFAEVAKFEPEIATEVAGSKAISGNGSMMFDTRGKNWGWQSICTIPLNKEGIYRLSLTCKLLETENNKHVAVAVAMREIKNGEKTRISARWIQKDNKKGHKKAQRIEVAGRLPTNSGEFDIVAERGIKIEIDDIKIEKFTADPKGAWMFDNDAFIGMTFTPANPEFHNFKEKFLNYSKEEFFPFIDKYGQFKHKDWIDKITCDEDFAKRMEAEKKFYKKIGKIPNRDQFCGLVREDQKYEATGHFRVQKIDGKWWFIDPEGNLFWSFGITCVGNLDLTPITDRESYFEDVSDKRFMKKSNWGLHYYKDKVYDSYGFLERNLVAKYGDNYREVYGDVSDERMRMWGFTTYGCWSQHYIISRGNFPFTAIATSGKAESFKTDVKIHAYWRDFPDFFTPNFEENTFKRVAQLSKLINMPACVGVFVDNELPWQFKPLTTIRALLGCPATQYSKIEFRKDLEAKYGTIEKLNEAWNAKYASWDDFLAKRDFYPKTKAGETDMLAFEEKIYVRYFKTCRDAVKAAAPNTLYLGCRFAWRNTLVEKVASRYCDVISYNVYSDNITAFSPVKGCEDKPSLIGEFHFGNTDKGVYGGGLNPRVTVEARKKAFENYAISAFENPNVVGAHWFQWFDLCTAGRFNAANYAIGFVDICDTPDYVIVKAARKLSQKMYKLRLKGGQSTTQSVESTKAVIDLDEK